mmetsp:Transcript_27773/g.83075  ORF Transcript_27773/g.83075 Transcript_27773/m.83075 type:complete len:208 (-) Transcript_27773:1458-2081(-)
MSRISSISYSESSSDVRSSFDSPSKESSSSTKFFVEAAVGTSPVSPSECSASISAEAARLTTAAFRCGRVEARRVATGDASSSFSIVATSASRSSRCFAMAECTSASCSSERASVPISVSRSKNSVIFFLIVRLDTALASISVRTVMFCTVRSLQWSRDSMSRTDDRTRVSCPLGSDIISFSIFVPSEPWIESSPAATPTPSCWLVW